MMGNHEGENNYGIYGHKGENSQRMHAEPVQFDERVQVRDESKHS